MNTRTAIQSSTDPAVLGIAFSFSRRRFLASLADGIRVLRTDNCLTTCQPCLGDFADFSSAIAVSEVLDDRYLAYVPRTDTTTGSGNTVIFWDCYLLREICRYDLHEPILGLRLSPRWMLVILEERSIIFAHRRLQQSDLPEGNSIEIQSQPEDIPHGPANVHALYPTTSNPFALASLRDDLLILPAQATGQVQLIPLPSGSKRVIRGHASAIRNLSLSADGTLIITASEQGTLVRVWDTRTTDQVAEFRRGVEKAIIYSLAVSPGNRWLASTSDKGTLHIYDLRPSPRAGTTTNLDQDRLAQSRKESRKIQNYASHRLSAGSGEKDSLSAFSGRSSSASATSTAVPAGVSYQGSVQQYYGLRPPPIPSAVATGRDTAVSAMSALRAASWAPKVLKDVRSVASTQFWTGNDGMHWQLGGAAGTGTRTHWTTAPSGMRKRVEIPVPSLANDPTGHPPRGILAFGISDHSEDANEDNGAVLYVVGGGAEGMWEAFDLVPVPPSQSGAYTGWALLKRGFRRFMSRQFVV